MAASAGLSERDERILELWAEHRLSPSRIATDLHLSFSEVLAALDSGPVSDAIERLLRLHARQTLLSASILPALQSLARLLDAPDDDPHARAESRRAAATILRVFAQATRATGSISAALRPPRHASTPEHVGPGAETSPVAMRVAPRTDPTDDATPTATLLNTPAPVPERPPSVPARPENHAPGWPEAPVSLPPSPRPAPSQDDPPTPASAPAPSQPPCGSSEPLVAPSAPALSLVHDQAPGDTRRLRLGPAPRSPGSLAGLAGSDRLASPLASRNSLHDSAPAAHRLRFPSNPPRPP